MHSSALVGGGGEQTQSKREPQNGERVRVTFISMSVDSGPLVVNKCSDPTRYRTTLQGAKPSRE